jgi:hypothetical protein
MAVRLAPLRKADDATLARWVGDCGAALTRPVPGAGLVELARERAWVAEFLAAVRAEQSRRAAVPLMRMA